MNDKTRGVPDYPRVKNVVYSTRFEVLALDLYLATAPGPRPALLYVHGGAWASGNKNGGYALALAPALAAAGVTVASLNYRLAPEWEFPAMIEDVKCAIRFLRSRALAWNIDPDRIGVIGNSAGGHLAALAGLTRGDLWDTGEWAGQSNAVALAVCLWGPCDLTAVMGTELRERLAVVFGAEPGALGRGSPLSYVGAGGAKFLIVNGLEDTTVPPAQALTLHHALLAAGGSSELLLVANAGHSLAQVGPEPILPGVDAVNGRIVEFVVEGFG